MVHYNFYEFTNGGKKHIGYFRSADEAARYCIKNNIDTDYIFIEKVEWNHYENRTRIIDIFKEAEKEKEELIRKDKKSYIYHIVERLCREMFDFDKLSSGSGQTLETYAKSLLQEDKEFKRLIAEEDDIDKISDYAYKFINNCKDRLFIKYTLHRYDYPFDGRFVARKLSKYGREFDGVLIEIPLMQRVSKNEAVKFIKLNSKIIKLLLKTIIEFRYNKYANFMKLESVKLVDGSIYATFSFKEEVIELIKNLK